MLTNKGSVNKCLNGILVLQFLQSVTEAQLCGASSSLALNHSALEGLSGATGAQPFHYNGYKTPANISKHAGLLASTTWPPAK